MFCFRLVFFCSRAAEPGAPRGDAVALRARFAGLARHRLPEFRLADDLSHLTTRHAEHTPPGNWTVVQPDLPSFYRVSSFFFRIQLEVVAVEKVPFNFEFRSLRAQSVENYFGRRYLGGKFWGLGYFPISILNIIWCEVQKFSDSASGSFRLPGTHFFFSGNVALLKNRIRSNAVWRNSLGME